MSIIDNINYLEQTKELIRQAIIAKGVDVPEDTPFADYVEIILQLGNE